MLVAIAAFAPELAMLRCAPPCPLRAGRDRYRPTARATRHNGGREGPLTDFVSLTLEEAEALAWAHSGQTNDTLPQRDNSRGSGGGGAADNADGAGGNAAGQKSAATLRQTMRRAPLAD